MPDLELTLRSLGERGDLFPDTPGISADVAAQIGGEREPASILDRPTHRWRMVAIVALVALAALAAALAIPRSRTAIADFFGIEGIRIEMGDEDDAPEPGTPTSIGGSLLLGERTTVDTAVRAAPFTITAPRDAVAGAPHEVYLNQRSGVTVVGLLWPASSDLPEIGDTGVGMLLLEIESDDDDVIFVKKMVGGGEFNTAMVGTWPGYWIEDGVLTVEPVEGLMIDLLEPQSRRSGNVLIWSDGETTYRLETSLPMADAVRIAESLAPVSAGDR